MSLLLPDERVDLLIAGLSLDPRAESISRLRHTLYVEPDAMGHLLNAAIRRQLLAAAIDNLETMGVLHPKAPRDACDRSRRAQLFVFREEWRQRRRALRAGLVEIVAALNAAGIEPLILKGSVSLLTGAPRWRHQRDIDFAVRPAERAAAITALMSIGFRDAAVSTVTAEHHHLEPMIRDGFPAVVEPHIRLTGRRAIYAIDESAMLARARCAKFDGLRVQLLRNEDFLLHGLAHHHLQNLGAVYGAISLKGLYEFCDGLRTLSPAETESFVVAARGNPRLASAVALWLAAGALIFSCPVSKSIQPALAGGDFAQARAMAIAARIVNGRVASRWRALYEDILGSFLMMRRPWRRDLRMLLARPLIENFGRRKLRVRRRKKLNAFGILERS
jgi:hypothetical protein